MKKVTTFFLILCLFTITLKPVANKADVVDTSGSIYEVEDSDGDKVLTITMTKGIITIIAKSSAASTSIRWETIGLTITAERVDENGASAKGQNGPVPVSSAYGNGYGVLWFSAAKKSDATIGNTVTTTITFTAEQVEKALGENFENITKDTTIYLHGIFDTYQIINGVKTLRKGANGGLRNWEDIMNAESWGTDTLNDFKKYFNMEIEFKPAPQKNTLYYYTEDNIKIGSKELDSVLPGENVYWNNEDTEKTYNSKSYNLIGYYVTKKSSTTKIDSRYLDDGWTLDKIRSSKVKVEIGGMNVYLIYRKGVTPTGTPTPTPKVSTAPTPTPRPSVTPRPTIPPVLTPVPSEPKSLALDVPSPYGVINGDNYGSPYFNSEKGISTTESQYVYIKTKDYLLGYTIVNRTGKKAFYVPVTMKYTLEYFTATPPQNGGPKKITEVVSDTQIIKVERAYSYWEITNLEYYNVSNGRVNNYSLPNGVVNMAVNNSFINIPSLSSWHSSNIDSHVLAPPQSTGITLTSPNVFSSATSTRPTVQYEDLSYYAQTMTDQAQVKNDYLKFGNSVVLSDTPSIKIAPSPNVSSLVHTSTIIHDKALYSDKNVIDDEKINGVFPSTGNVTYSLHPSSVNASHSSKSYNVGVNDVTIHTPVICVPVVTADNTKWSQLINPNDDAVQIVLDPDNTLNDFNVSISNTLKHSNRLGYLSRDFSRSFIDPTYISYIARKNLVVRNEVKFPFDVYMDTNNDNDKSNDKYIKSDTWIVLGRDTFRFYVPLWIQEGVYTVDFRSIAVNGVDKLNMTEKIKNADLNNYVATSTVDFEISGRLYGLKLYDISDYPKWENVFRLGKTMKFKLFEGAIDGTTKSLFSENSAYYYSLGTKNQYGQDMGTLNRFTLPLINGSHPKYNNLGVLKSGYAVRFMLDTVGELHGGASAIKIYPSFYYVDANGKNRKMVDLYYSEEIEGKKYNLVKVGSGVDLVNIKMGSTGNIYSRIPEVELKNTAKVQGISFTKWFNQLGSMYTYSTFRIAKEFRTFVGTEYSAEISSLNSFDDVKSITGMSSLDITKYMQRWYGTYRIPENVHAVETGYDVYGYLKRHGIDYKESFWMKNGYIIVNFNIVTVDKSGKERLSYANGNNYINKGYCSMSIMEGAPLSKKDSKGIEYKFLAGDFLFFYTDKKFADDYEGVLY